MAVGARDVARIREAERVLDLRSSDGAGRRVASFLLMELTPRA
jgi:hypothetical protein